MFKQECTKFLDTITAMRTSAISQAVAEAVRVEHIPYVEQVTAARNAVIAEETRKTEERIRALQEDLKLKTNAYTAETERAIADHRQRVTNTATEKAKAAYDGFILGVGKLVDETKID